MAPGRRRSRISTFFKLPIPTKVPGRRLAPIARFMRKVYIDPHGCWLWLGCRSRAGYGRFGLGGRKQGTILAHRFSYEHAVGPIPWGRTLDHLCRNPACVRPSHLEPVSQQENCQRGLKGRLHTHCANGHLYDEANTYRRPGSGHRGCRACNRERGRRRLAIQRLEAHR